MLAKSTGSEGVSDINGTFHTPVNRVRIIYFADALKGAKMDPISSSVSFCFTFGNAIELFLYASETFNRLVTVQDKYS